MKNMIILFAGLKGGTGKSTLCNLFATYAVEQGFPVAVMDADTQLSLYKNFFEDLATLGVRNVSTPWRIWSLRADDTVKDKMSKIKKVPGLVIIDCPGSVDNENLKYIYNSADIIVMPFRFDRMNVRETVTFAELLKKISKARQLYLPNMVTQYDEKREELRKAMERANSDLGKYGRVLPGIPECLAVRDSNTLGMNYKQRWAVREAYNVIIEEINTLINK